MLQPDMHDSENGTHSANGAETLVLTANNLVYPEPSSTYYDVININQHHNYHHYHHNQHLHNNHYHNHHLAHHQTTSAHQYHDTITTNDIGGTINITESATASNTTQSNNVDVRHVNPSNNNDLSLFSNNQNNTAPAAMINSNITTAIAYQSTLQQHRLESEQDANLLEQQNSLDNNPRSQNSNTNNDLQQNHLIKDETETSTQAKVVANIETLSNHDDKQQSNTLGNGNNFVDDIMIDNINDELNVHKITAEEKTSPPLKTLDTTENIISELGENVLFAKNLSSDNICNKKLEDINPIDANNQSVQSLQTSREYEPENHLVFLSKSSLKADMNYDSAKINVDCNPPTNNYSRQLESNIEFDTNPIDNQENEIVDQDDDDEFDEDEEEEEEDDEEDEEEEEDDEEEGEYDDEEEEEDDEDENEHDEDSEEDNEVILDPGQHCQQVPTNNDDFIKHDILTNANDMLDGERMLEVTRKLVRNTERDPDRDLRKQVLLKTAIKRLPHFMDYNRYSDSLDRSFQNNMSPQSYYEHHHDPQQKLYNSVQPNAIQMSTTGLRMLDLNDDHDPELTNIEQDHSDPNLVYNNNRNTSLDQHEYISQHHYDRYHQRAHELNHYEPSNSPLIRHNSLDNLYQPINASDINEEIKDSSSGEERIPIAFQIACEIYDFTCSPDDNDERKLLDNLSNYYVKPTKESKTDNSPNENDCSPEEGKETRDPDGSDTSSSSHSSASALDESANSIGSSTQTNESDETDGTSLLEASLNTTGEFYHTSQDSGVALFTSTKSNNKRSSSSIGLDDEMDIDHLTELSSRSPSFGSNNQYKKLRKREIIE